MARRMSWLSTRGRDIVNEAGEPVLLKGYCLGGWLNTENFINGYPFTDHAYFAALCEVLGGARAQHYYERQYEYYLQEADIELLADCGTNCVRLPFNYRIFESDLLPGEYCPAGFEYFDRLVKWCRKHGLYIILELHAAQGWQNPDWHCDNPDEVCLLWGDRHYRDRVAKLWRAIAERYKDEPTIAGYELLNEPTAPDNETLQGFYEEVTRKVRRVDRRHIIFLEGNMWGTRFKGLKPFAKNLVYACHIYPPAAFERRRPYPNAEQNAEAIARAYQGYADFGRRQDVPMWCGEFGCQHNMTDPALRKGRLQCVDDMIAIFEGHGHSWSMWTYKDMGVMGLVTVKGTAPYMRRTRAVRALKEQLGVDQWTADHAAFARLIKPVVRKVQQACAKRVAPQEVDQRLARSLRDACGRLLLKPFAEQFEGMTKRQIDAVMKSWKLENCRVNKGLVRILKRHAA